MQPKLYIFDLDGTLRWTTIPGQVCPYHPGQWKLMPNVSNTLRRLDWKSDGIKLGIASNQESVAEGHLTREMAHRLVLDTIEAAIGFVPQDCWIELCTCSISRGCPRRKPRPEMLSSLVARFEVEGDDAVFVGDLETDRMAAITAGVRFTWAWDFFGWPVNSGE